MLIDLKSIQKRVLPSRFLTNTTGLEYSDVLGRMTSASSSSCRCFFNSCLIGGVKGRGPCRFGRSPVNSIPCSMTSVKPKSVACLLNTFAYFINNLFNRSFSVCDVSLSPMSILSIMSLLSLTFVSVCCCLFNSLFSYMSSSSRSSRAPRIAPQVMIFSSLDGFSKRTVTVPSQTTATV